MRVLAGRALRFGVPVVSRIPLVARETAPGIAAVDRERVFEPFHRTPGARASGLPGHGIGLALVAHVAALHAGRASFVAPDAERGARLRIELPLA